MASSTLRADFRIHGLDCAEEVTLIRRQLDNTTGLHQLGFDVVNGRMSAEFDPAVLSPADIIQRIGKTGLKAEPWDPSAGDESNRGGGAHGGNFWDRHGRLVMAGISGVSLAGAIALEGFFGPSHTGLFQAEHIHRTSPQILVLAIAAIVAGMYYSARKAWAAIQLVQPDMNVLVCVSILGASYLGEWTEAATLAFLFALAGIIESWSLGRARAAIGTLMKETPSEATILHGPEFSCCGHEPHPTHQAHAHEHRVTVESVTPGTLVRVRPGEKIPCDGEVSSGASGVNEALLTGESTPVLKEPGDQVLAGSISLDGLLDIRSTKPATDTTLARIIRMVEESQQRRAPSEQFVERFSKVYTPAMMLVALLMALLPPLLLDWSWSRAFYQSMVVLLIACPCALVISTPVTIAAAIASAARRGVLIKGGAYLEAAARLRTVAFDKTGVLTSGKPEVQRIDLLTSQLSEEQFLDYVAALESGSEHPLAQAIVRYATQRRGFCAVPASNFRALPGRGAEAIAQDGRPLWAGSERYATDLGIALPASQGSEPGSSIVYVGSGPALWGRILLRDQLRPAADDAVSALRTQGVTNILILTGDGETAASQIARQLSVDRHHSGMLPAGKADTIRALRQETGGDVAMVGDGVNDAEAMAVASLGIAFGPSSTGLAMETADAVILSEDPMRVPFLVGHAKRSLSVIKQNLALALGSKLAFLAVVLLGTPSLWMAVAADMGATLVVTFNGLRLLRAKD